MPDYRFNFDFIPLPLAFIDSLLTETNGAYIRVYLYMLSLAVKGEALDNPDIAKNLNLLESDVINAVSYWQEKNMIEQNGDTIIFKNGENLSAQTSDLPDDNGRKSADLIQNMMEQDKELADLCMVAQEILGRVLTKTEIETIYWFYDTLGFTPDVISLLLEYCVSINKTNIGYIEKVAIGWNENGIKTIEAAMEFMENESSKKSSYQELRKIFEINDRNFTGIEKNYIKTWTEQYGMTQSMIALAYEYCIMRTNKLSFPYMDSIMKNWNKKGIDSVSKAQQDQENFKSKNQKFQQKNTSVYEKGGYDADTIDKLMRDKYN